MARVLDDDELRERLREPKPLPLGWRKRLLSGQPKKSLAHAQSDVSVKTEAGHSYRLIVRRSVINPLDFSVILMFNEMGVDYILRRHNGRHSSAHTNHWGKRRGLPSARFEPAFHVHHATERYQLEGLAIDGYAEATTRYSDLHGALDTVVTDAHFMDPDPGQARLL